MDKNNMYQDYGDFVFRYLLTLTNNKDLAEELTQETFYQAIKSIDNYQDNGKAKFSTWLCAVAKNVWMKELTRIKNSKQVVDSLSDKSDLFYSLEEEYFKNEDKLIFFKKAHQLDERKKEVIYLRLLGDLSFKEIGLILGETENWARVTFYRAKQQLRKEDYNYES